jgi:imidazoleglycerol-phosphate dehydratase/histidinol-phosphatase
MKKILFIDRDGTLALEPDGYQLDAFEKLEFYPNVFTYLGKIAKELEYKLVMVTNQDGLGTKAFPEETFWPVQNFIVQSFKNEGVEFEEVLIDKSFPQDNAPTRKPRTGMLTQYMNTNDYDLKNSYVIGDRFTDMELANNLGCQGIFIANDPALGAEESSPEAQNAIVFSTTAWKEIYTYLKLQPRKTSYQRNTKETQIELDITLEGSGKGTIDTGIPFFDHMLDQLARHGGIDLNLQTKGDLHVDEHHTIEDTAIALGEAFYQALGDKLGMERYGFCLPMDDCLAQVAIDFGGRNWIVWDADFKREKIGEMPTEMFFHFFKSFSDGAKANLNIKAEGTNEHHKIEAIFKAFAKAIKRAIQRDPDRMILPSTKGML